MAKGGNSGSAPTRKGGVRIKLNVGGKLFETTVATLQSGGPDSLLSALSTRPESPTGDPIFIDRDPEVFSILLSLLRSNRLPSTAARFSKQELAEEASYYGIEAHLRAAMSPPELSGTDASMVSTVLPAADGLPSAFSAGQDGSLWIAHGGQISSFDWALCHVATIRTHLDEISSILRVFPEVAAVGSSDSGAGLHFYDLAGSRHIGSVHWSDPADPRVYKARIASLTDSSDYVFAAFDCPHRENSVLSIDKNTLQAVSEIGRQPGSSSKSIVPRKLTWVPGMGALVGSAITCGAFGYSGYIRIWDPRAGSIVWETNEPGSGRSSRYGDSFADVDVDAENSLLFKVCSKSGDLAMADLRSLRDDPWVYLEDKSSNLKHDGGQSSLLLHCYKDQVFLGRDGALEVWSKVAQRGEVLERVGGGLYRRNFVDKEEDSLRGIIRKIEGGGNRLFVSREDMEGIEVWESSHLSGVTPISSCQIR